MKMALWGAGRFGKKMLSILQEDIAVLADNNPVLHGQRICGKEVVDLEGIKHLYCQGQIDTLVICVMSERERTQITLQVLKYEIRNIYFVPSYLMDIEEVSRDLIYSRLQALDNVKPTLDYLELWVSESCNLNCRGCGYFCNLMEVDKFPSLEQFKKDIRRLSFFFDNIVTIRLMGGEPLLNPELEEYILETRSIFPEADVHIVTNGLLLKQMPRQLCECIRYNRVQIDISYYPVLENSQIELRKWLYEHRLNFQFTGKINSFYKKLRLEKKSDPVTENARCPEKTCHFMYNGKIAHCGMQLSVERLSEKYGLDISSEDIHDLYKTDLTPWELCMKLESEVDLCAYCSKEVYFPWSVAGREDISMEDWIVQDSDLI